MDTFSPGAHHTADDVPAELVVLIAPTQKSDLTKIRNYLKSLKRYVLLTIFNPCEQIRVESGDQVSATRAALVRSSFPGPQLIVYDNDESCKGVQIKRIPETFFHPK
jgi:hypothetical protein